MLPDKFLPSLPRFRRLIPGLVLFICLSACERDAKQLPSGSGSVSDTSTEEAAPQHELAADEAEPLVDGFYGENPAPDKGNEVSPEATALVKKEPVQEPTAESNPVASIGFSTLEETPPPVDDALPADACTAPDNTDAVSTQQACQRISKRLASISMNDCESANLSISHCQSVQRFPILVREFPPLDNRTPQGRVLVIGGTHGDELTSVSVVFRWIAKLNRFHSGMFHWRIAPMINPDGVLKREATRTNQNGVDLNRNMPSDDWDENALKYWDEKSGKNKRRYPGPHAASEPETQWLIEEIESFKPDAIISVHAPFGVVDYDSLALNAAPKQLGKLALNLLGTYPGSLGNYAGINRNIPVITLELPHAWVMPSERESTKIWEDIVSWLRKNVNRPASVSEAN